MKKKSEFVESELVVASDELGIYNENKHLVQLKTSPYRKGYYYYVILNL